MRQKPALRRHRRTKIVATLGPASSTPEVIEALFQAGADVFRLNFSHGTHEDHLARLNTIRGIEKRAGRPIGVLVDVQGPKLRVGSFGGGACRRCCGSNSRNPTSVVGLPVGSKVAPPSSTPFGPTAYTTTPSAVLR